MVILWLFVARMSVPACRLIYCCAIERRSIWKSFSLLKGPQRCGLLHLIPYQSTCKRTWLILIRTPSFSCILELFGENCKVVLCWHTIPAFWLVDWWRSTTPWDYISKRQQRLRIQSQLWEPRKFEIQFFKKQLSKATWCHYLPRYNYEIRVNSLRWIQGPIKVSEKNFVHSCFQNKTSPFTLFVNNTPET